MTIHRYNAKRDISEAAIVDALRKAGATVFLTPRPFDSVVGYRGATHLVEYKTGKAKLNANQQDFLKTWNGSAVYVMRSVEDAIRFLKEAK